MIILITGVPGSGKTSLALDMLVYGDDFKNRPLFVMGVPELKIEHSQVPPVEEWTTLRASPEDESILLPYFTFPENAVILVDEAQRIYRPRAAASKVPAEVAAFETHRHTGVDFILLTQHPSLIDANVRKLVGRHIHVHISALKRELCEWPRLGDVDSSTDRGLAARRDYKPPKRVFDLYKSAEAHTKIKRTLPKMFYLLIFMIPLAILLGWYSMSRIKSRMGPESQTQVQGQIGQGAIPFAGIEKQSSGSGAPKTTAQYIEEQTPRLPGLAHTAPVYDNITQPVDAPVPAGCIISARLKACRCVDQQGNNYHTTQEVCIQIVKNGIFIPWKKQDLAQAPQAGSTQTKPLMDLRSADRGVLAVADRGGS